MVAARGARRAGRGRRLAARTSRAARRSRRCSGRPRISRRSPTGAREELAAALVRVRRAGARASSSARCSRRRRGDPPPIDGAVAFLEGAGHARHARARRATRCSSCSATARRPSRSRSSCRRSTAGARRSRPCSRRLGIPYAVDGRARLAGDAARPRAALAAPLRVGRRRPRASSTRSSARRTRASRARASTSPRAGCAAARSRRPSCVEEETERLREAPLVAAARAARAAESPVDGVRVLLGSMLRSAYGLDGAAGRRRRRGSTCAASPRPRGCSTSSTAGSALGEPLAADDVIAALERLEVRPATRGEPGRVAVLDLMRARTRRFERRLRARARGGVAAAARRAARRSSTTTAGASSARRLERPDPVSRDRYLFYTACTRATRRLCSCARRRPTTARRASRARSGTRSRPSSTRTTWRARRGGARSRS